MFSLKLSSCENLKKVVTHLETYGFVKTITENGPLKKFLFGPLGQLLMQNVKSEWIFSNVTYRDHNVFLFDSELPANSVEGTRESFKFAKELSHGEAPFGLVQIKKEIIEICSENEADFCIPQTATILRHLTILSPSEAEQYYYRWQQQRKRWWRMFSADPSRFTFAKSDNIEGSIGAEAKIMAGFPWGEHCLESIRYHGPTLYKDLDMISQNLFSVRGNGKRSIAHVVETTMNLDLGTFTYMCDAFKQRKALKYMCTFHRKLAPYKFGFAAGPVSSEKAAELLDLCKYLGIGLRKAGLSTLLPGADLGRKSLTPQLARHSALGIPYSLVVTEDTLVNGIAGLYSMLTTLQEDVHIANFEEYGMKLMKNY